MGLDAMKTLAILVGGGPAPGINAVIAAATIEARNHGLRVLGCYDGFKWLVQGDTYHVIELEINEHLAHPLRRRLDPPHLAHQPDQDRGRHPLRGRERSSASASTT